MAAPFLSSIPLTERAKALPGSPIRALLNVHRSSDTLDLGGGIPDPALFPSAVLARVTERVIAEQAAASLQYAPTEGLSGLREFIAARLNRRGCKVDAARIIVTHGSQQALAAVAALLAGPAQPVALEQPGYPGALQAFALAQARVVALPVTADGWDLEALRGRGASAVYVIPNYQNPTGRKASLAARQELAEYAETSGTVLVEDDAYGELDFEGVPPRPLLALAPRRTVLLGTFSKTLCPGFRVGWVAAPSELIDPLVRILQASSLQPGTLAQHLVAALLEQLDYEKHLTVLRVAYRKRAQALQSRCEALGLVGEAPDGGFFLWMRTAAEARRVAERARAEQLLAVPEVAFRHPQCPGPDAHLRLAFTRFTDSPAQCMRLAAGLSS